ncbi:MAG: hypothetical protein FRX49_13439 [Trebouxia sp. A1-2]|nr:MAG: hypothetical protein FRX49_13439 [Trebouxia sp. A1-2]
MPSGTAPLSVPLGSTAGPAGDTEVEEGVTGRPPHEFQTQGGIIQEMQLSLVLEAGGSFHILRAQGRGSLLAALRGCITCFFPNSVI